MVILCLVSIPFIAGQWSLLAVLDPRSFISRVSIPFIAGQWSLPCPQRAMPSWTACFNPLHCGAVVASLGMLALLAAGLFLFQSPSLRGSGRFLALALALHLMHLGVSIPFIAGQWSLLCHIDGSGLICNVSIPFIAGQWSLRLSPILLPGNTSMFQSPSLRGSGRFRDVVP